VLRTTKAQARAAIELLGLLEDNILGEFYTIIPRGIDKELGNQLYGDLLRTNNDVLNTLRSITVVNWPEELFNDYYNPASSIEGTIAIRVDKLLMNVWKCVAIEKTMDTETRGKYMLIFKEEDIEKAKESIGDLIEAFGRNSDRKCAKIALEKFQEFPEFDSIQRVSQSVQSKGQRIRQMLEEATTQRTKSTPTKQLQPKFQFHVNKNLQQQLPITTHKTYSTIASQHTTPTKQPRTTQTETRRVQVQQNIEQQVTMTQETVPTQTPTPIYQQEIQTPLTNQTTDTRTIATNNSGLSADQQTIATMMTQMTQQFKEMERERIVREDRQEMIRQEREAKAEEKREEREARIEEKRVDAQREMYEFMQKMMIMNQNNSNNNNNNNNHNINNNSTSNNNDTNGTTKEIPEELATGTSEQTSALTTSIATTSTEATLAGKRSSSVLSTGTTDKEKETTLNDENSIIKRNKRIGTSTAEEDKEEDKILDDHEEMLLEMEQETTTAATEDMIIEKDTTGESFTNGFNNQQFKSTTRTAPWPGVNQQ
jgi:hypothetical protein